MSSVTALPGPLRPETRDALLAIYRAWLGTRRAEPAVLVPSRTGQPNPAAPR